MSEIKGNSVLILGFAREGKSTLKFLKTHYPHIKIGIADKNEASLTGLTDIELFSGEDYLKSTEQFDTIIRSPGINTRTEELLSAKNRGAHITTATNIFFSRCAEKNIGGKIIGITGTKGKGTTSTFISELLRMEYSDVRLVGNIGHPALEELETATSETIFVYELSSFQLEDCRYSPNIAVLLNIYPEHIDFHKNFEDYRDAKSSIANLQSETDYLIYNSSHESIFSIAQGSKAKKIHYGSSVGSCFIENGYFYLNNEPLIEENAFKLVGKANRENLQAAITCAQLFSLKKENIRNFIANVKALPYRLEHVGKYRGIDFYNDSYATNQRAAVNAIDALEEKIETLLAGGFDRGFAFDELGEAIAKTKLKHLILFPSTGEKIWQIVAKTNSSIQPYFVNSMEEAIEIAYKNTSKEKACLLAPGCPSFGIFKDYKDRGDAFLRCILEKGHT